MPRISLRISSRKRPAKFVLCVLVFFISLLTTAILIANNLLEDVSNVFAPHPDKTLPVSSTPQTTRKSIILDKLQNADLIIPQKDGAPAQSATVSKLNYNVHIFYYPWYGNPQTDGRYMHWNHEFIPHWDKREAQKWPVGKHKPPDDIGTNFYPQLGPYSSRDAHIMSSHMKQIAQAGVGVMAVSWYPPELADGQGVPWDHLMAPLLDAADVHSIKICFHIEPYKGRSAASLKQHIKYIIDTYGEHPAFYRRARHGVELPLFYLYDSYLIKSEEWRELLTPNGPYSIRSGAYDSIIIGLVVEHKHKQELLTSGFDGYYTYFASTGFTFGSNPKNWKDLSRFARDNDLLFIPSVGPGYIDDRVRPWNKQNTKSRDDGKYYERSFTAAIDSHPAVVSITSFNEWHEGTQIEAAVPKTIDSYTYLDYLPNQPDYYLMLTQQLVKKYRDATSP